MEALDAEYGYRCRRCGQGTAYGSLVTEDGQVKLWCFACLKDALDAAPHDAAPLSEPSAKRQAPSAARRNDDAP
jgi:hypothetical protein